ncbi:hypothetical protein EDD16DRAFT_1892747 [Pisolithus croceorrhizus]|nr:hypothetical protein EDD16DRAFT_1892747 [Pisolithus croceorrhizus]KAI6150092.1 hypothetical protein EDD17DRAFT_1640762 [Pisolithus thermaeus]
MTAPPTTATHSSTETSDVRSVLPSPPTSPVSSAGNFVATRIRLKAIRTPRTTRNSSVDSVSVQSECRGELRYTSAVPHTTGNSNGTATPASIKAKRRQSSIAYFTPSSPSPWERDGQRHRPNSSRAGPNPTPSPSSGSELLEDEGGGGKRASLATNACSHPSGDSIGSLEGIDTKEREPLTLVEKHADLLHFIAQKERKCLELREQLAIHEHELAELKRKWERIINRTLPTGGCENLVSTSSTNAVLGGTTLDGIKEGVRRITLGLSDLGGGASMEPSQLLAAHFPDESAPPVSVTADSAPGLRSSRFSTSSISSFCEAEAAHGSTHVEGSVDAVRSSSSDATSSIRRSGSLHRRPARSHSKDLPTPVSLSTGIELGHESLAPAPWQQAAASPSFSTRTATDKQSRRTTLAPSLPPPSSVPGLGSLTMGAGVGSPVSSWMGSVGKKLGGIQSADTLAKGQKRASVLLADVSHSIMSALSPSPSTASVVPPPTSNSISSFSSDVSSPRTPLSKVEANKNIRIRGTNSLLDEDDEDDTVRIGRVMVPDSVRDGARAVVGSGTQTQRAAVSSLHDDDDDSWSWNW